MYTEADPVVKYYDFSLALCPQSEVQYYSNFANSKNGPCLDLCCGTGILSLKIAESGKQVFALDNSNSMLEKLKSKITAKNENNIVIIKSLMNSFSLPAKVDSVICRDAFFHNLSPDDERNTLLSINRNLNKNGLFAFNIHYPNPQFLIWAASTESSEYLERGVYKIPDSENKLRISQSLGIDYDSQIITTKLKFDIIDENDAAISTETSEWKSRYIYPYEMFYLLELCGFKIYNVYGNYQKEPYNSNTMVVIEAEKIVEAK